MKFSTLKSTDPTSSTVHKLIHLRELCFMSSNCRTQFTVADQKVYVTLVGKQNTRFSVLITPTEEERTTLRHGQSILFKGVLSSQSPRISQRPFNQNPHFSQNPQVRIPLPNTQLKSAVNSNQLKEHNNDYLNSSQGQLKTSQNAKNKNLTVIGEAG